jgi:hypothetical protein
MMLCVFLVLLHKSLRHRDCLYNITLIGSVKSHSHGMTRRLVPIFAALYLPAAADYYDIERLTMACSKNISRLNVLDFDEAQCAISEAKLRYVDCA